MAYEEQSSRIFVLLDVSMLTVRRLSLRLFSPSVHPQLNFFAFDNM